MASPLSAPGLLLVTVNSYHESALALLDCVFGDEPGLDAVSLVDVVAAVAELAVLPPVELAPLTLVMYWPTFRAALNDNSMVEGGVSAASAVWRGSQRLATAASKPADKIGWVNVVCFMVSNGVLTAAVIGLMTSKTIAAKIY